MGYGAIIVGAVAAAAGLYQQQESRKAGEKQSREARRIARQNALAIAMENMEVARRYRLRMHDTLARGRTYAAASGLSGLSHQRYLERLERQALDEAEWIRKSSILQQEKEIALGMATSKNIRARAGAQAAQGTAQMIGGFGQIVGAGIDNWITQNRATTGG